MDKIIIDLDNRIAEAELRREKIKQILLISENLCESYRREMDNEEDEIYRLQEKKWKLEEQCQSKK
jgi:endonuclease III